MLRFDLPLSAFCIPISFVQAPLLLSCGGPKQSSVVSPAGAGKQQS